MHIHILLSSLCFFASISSAAYTLQDDYGDTDSFFDKFDFWSQPDPSAGFVKYLDQRSARSTGLISADGGSVYIGVDNSSTTTTGRSSVRISSKNRYTKSLFILDLAHMPASTCGSWPAFWLLGSGVDPVNGEIDIIEGVDRSHTNSMTLHATRGCTINNSSFTGKLTTSDCYDHAKGQGLDDGCGISNPDTRSFGTGFNEIGGGVYATVWTSEGISIWFFGRDTGIPSDITKGTPDPSTWGLPAGRFAGDCDFDAHFKNMTMIFNIDFCSAWARGVFDRDPVCSKLADSCRDYVGKNPTAFGQTYWGINGLKVYKNSADQDSDDANCDAKTVCDHHLHSPKQLNAPPSAMRARSRRNRVNYFK
ncbi:CAZyme family GH16 [Penicillium riverlandense]|uniref:CAZyme family GH16 n=1 Tax=Penicillium riverlandense TaxID=1903569 RepID=UPI0025482130|nr:CAZyme family GH16 [Penicillium riverlandense]KAJ5820337.1 CAZyme family GH16 [Penicillium riverlandense]